MYIGLGVIEEMVI